jgi:hypothetical protein
VEIVDIHRWARGSGPCQLRFTAPACQVLGAATPSPPCSEDCDIGRSQYCTVTVRYANGPCLRICGEGATTFATFVSEFRDRQSGTRDGSRLEGTPALVVGRGGCGMGIVALSSPHMEDGRDASTLVPFANLARLISRNSFYQQWKCGESTIEGAKWPGGAWAEDINVRQHTTSASGKDKQSLTCSFAIEN